MSQAALKLRLPFSFAKRHGVLLLASAGAGPVSVLFKAGIEPAVLMEVRRYVGAGVNLQQVDGPTFDGQLSSTYQNDAGEAMQMIEGLGEGMDLSSLADMIPEMGDLL